VLPWMYLSLGYSL